MGHNAFKIGPNVLSGNTNSFDALFENPSISPLIAGRIISHFASDSIDFDRNARRFAEEVEHEVAERVLLSKPQAFWTLPQHPPEPDFGRAHPFAILTGLVNGQF